MFRFVIFIIVFGAAALFLFGETAHQTIGISGDQTAALIATGLFAVVISAGVFGSGIGFGKIIKQLSIWFLIIVGLTAGYEYRYELQDVANRVGGGLLPGSAISTLSDDGMLTVAITKRGNHFLTNGTINDVDQRFIVDTGASTIVLTNESAQNSGIPVEDLSYSVRVSTANGSTNAAAVRLERVTIGDIERQNLQALIAQPGDLEVNLLGMNFLDTLTGFDVRGDRLLLRN